MSNEHAGLNNFDEWKKPHHRKRSFFPCSLDDGPPAVFLWLLGLDPSAGEHSPDAFEPRS
jgi:hypothetical protein